MTIMLAHPFIWSGAFVATLCGIALLVWALFADRARGRRRCGKCWYPMDRATSLRCPECGHEAKSDRALYRTRRRRKWAAVSLLPLLLAAFLAVQPKVQRDGWGSVMPATVLILLLRLDDRQWVLDGIEYHLNETQGHPLMTLSWSVPMEDNLWQWQWRWLARSVLMRIEDEERGPRRTTYHSWLSLGAYAGGDAALRQTCMDALVRDLAHPDGNVRRSAAVLSIDYEDVENSIGRAVELLGHDDARTRVAGVMSLRLIAQRTRRGIPALIDALQHEDAAVRRQALWAIGATARSSGPVPEAFDPVYALEHDEDGDVRYQRIMTLADLLSGDEAWYTIDSALRHEDPHVRRGGLYAAYERHPRPSHVSVRLIELLDDPDATVRRHASGILEYIDDDVLMEQADLLKSLVSHDDPDVRRAAAVVWYRIRGAE